MTTLSTSGLPLRYLSLATNVASFGASLWSLNAPVPTGLVLSSEFAASPEVTFSLGAMPRSRREAKPPFGA